MSLRNILLLSVAILGSFAIWNIQSPDENHLAIGILQTASHPALDQVREQFEARLTELTQGRVRFVRQNAEGSLAQAKSIAESLHAQKKIQAIFAIGTPAVQAASRVEKQKPILIAAVSEPEALGLGANVCGTTDRVDAEAQADLIVKLVPEVKRVSILFCQSENNSQVMVKKMLAALEKRGIKPFALGLNNEGELPQAVPAAIRKGDAILIPTDNMMASAMAFLAKEAKKAKCPLIASDILLVEKGALAAQGADYGELGRATAEIAHRVLVKGVKPEEAGILDPTQTSIVINKDVFKELELPVPQGESISFVGGDNG